MFGQLTVVAATILATGVPKFNIMLKLNKHRIFVVRH